MCRLAAYLGEPVALGALLYEPAHALERQAYLPGEMVSGHVNVDGTGVAWWSDGEPQPLSYVSDRPPWSDPNLPGLARRLRGSPILGVVRSQTPGMPAGTGAVQPFVVGDRAGAHNGYLEKFDEVRFELFDHIDDAGRRALHTVTDSVTLVLMAASAVRAGASPAEALVTAAETAARACDAVGGAASLNLVLADAERVVALRKAHGVPANSLYVLQHAGTWPGGVVLASEPLDGDPGWREVPPDHVVELTADDVRVEAVSS